MPEALRIFSLASNMNWSHLPVPGGLYAQDPRLLDGLQVIFNMKGEHEAEEHKRQMDKINKK